MLVSLGTWQVQRLAWKEAVLADIETRIAAEPVAIPAAPDPVEDRFLPVTAEGAYVQGELHVLASVKRVGPGYRIIAPFETDGRRIMVDRGFISTEAKAATRPLGAAVIEGNLHWPDEIDGFTPEPDVAGNIWFARDVPAMAEALGTEPLLVVLRNAPTGEGYPSPLPVDTAGIPNDHLEYALTWFSLAIIWVVMTGAFLWRQRRRNEG